MRTIAFPIAAAVAVLAITGCGGGSGSSTPGVVPTLAPTSPPTTTPDAAIVIKTSTGSTSISLVGFGATAQVTATESGYSGDFLASSSDVNVATITPPMQAAGAATFTITAVNGGTSP